ncbi:MAG: MFS transporter [Atribacterota bacterium]|nr:MFS transporter [Atribacterota bacterium]
MILKGVQKIVVMLKKDDCIIFSKHKIYYGWIIVLISFACMMFSYGARYIFSVFFKPMAEDFGWSRTMTSGVFSLYMITYAFGSVITGRIVDKYGPKLLIIGGSILLGGGIYACSFVSEIYQLYIFYGLLVGIGSAATGWVIATTTIARWFTDKRGLATGLTSTGSGLGNAIFIPLATIIVASYGWRFSYQLFGILIILILLPAGFFAFKAPHLNIENNQNVESKKLRKFAILEEKNSINSSEAMKKSTFWMLAATQFLMTFQLNVVMIHFIPYATDLGLSATMASRYIALLSLVSILGRVYGGWFADRIGRQKIVAFAMLIQAFSFILLPFIKNYMFLFFFIGIYGISYGAWISQSAPFAADIFGSRYFGSLWGIITLGIGVGGAFGPLLAGIVFDLTKSYLFIFAINLIISLFSFLLILFFVKPIDMPASVEEH